MPNKIYLDHVSTTKTYKEVLDTYKKLLDEYYCNSDALYDDGVAVYRLQEQARANIAKMLNVRNNEIIFTSGASEASSLAIKGLCLENMSRKHIITSIYEHSSVYNAIKQMEEKLGFEVTYLMPNQDGVIEPEAVRKALREDTLLVSIMCVNNEIGAINDINTIKEIVKKESKAYFHTDMTQALAKIDIDLKDVDMASFSAHKIHGLKGSGFLYKRDYIKLAPLISGGQQEFAIRGGTSNALVNIVLAKTLRLALEDFKTNHSYVNKLYNYCLDKLKELDFVKINSCVNGIDNLINISTCVTSEVMMNALNAKGMMVSSKSTCGSRENEPSRVLKSMDIDDNYAIRISFDKTNTKEEIDIFINNLKEIVNKYGRN